MRFKEHLTRDQRPFLHPESLRSSDSQLLLSVHLTHLLQGSVREHLTRDQRPFLHPESLPDPLDSQLLLFSSPHSSSTGFRSENTWHEIRRPFLHPESLPDLQIHSFSSSVHLTHLLQGSDQRTPDTRSETVPSSRITPDPLDSTASPLQFTSLIFYRVQIREHLTRDQRPFLHPRITPDLQIHSFSSSVHLTHVLQGSDQRTHWQEIIDHSFIQNHSRSSDSQLLSSVHSSSTGFRSENTWHEIKTVPSSRITPDP